MKGGWGSDDMELPLDDSAGICNAHTRLQGLALMTVLGARGRWCWREGRD